MAQLALLWGGCEMKFWGAGVGGTALAEIFFKKNAQCLFYIFIKSMACSYVQQNFLSTALKWMKQVN